MFERAASSVLDDLFWAILAAQSLVPVMQLDETRPARFGWQMFSCVGRPAGVEVESADGTIHPVDVETLLARPRPEMDLPTTALCARRAARPGPADVRCGGDPQGGSARPRAARAEPSRRPAFPARDGRDCPRFSLDAPGVPG